MTDDPLGDLCDSLAYLFELQKSKRSGEYINPLVQNLKEALDEYKSDSPSSLQALTVALKNALPIIDNYGDTHTVKEKMDVLAGTKGKTISWYTASRPAYSPKFQYAADNLRTEGDFISWLSLRSGQDFAQLEAEQQVQILTERSETNFKTKLGVYLRSNPEFLANLAMKSPKLFKKLLNSPLGSQLEKHQVDKAIDYHGLDTEEKKYNY